MYETKDLDTIATITELRTKTSDLLEEARRSGRGVLIQRNNEPHMVLVPFERYVKWTEERERQKGQDQTDGRDNSTTKKVAAQ